MATGKTNETRLPDTMASNDTGIAKPRQPMHPIHTLSDRLKIHLGMPVAEFRAALGEAAMGIEPEAGWDELSMAMEAGTIHDLDCDVGVTFRDGVLAKIEYGLMEYYGSRVVPPGAEPGPEES